MTALKHTLTAKQRRQNRLFWAWGLLLMVVSSALYGFGNRAYGLFDVDEAIFTQATEEMRAAKAEHGLAALAMPTYNGTPRYHKPPLIYWAQDATLSLLDPEDFLPNDWGLFAARFPSILGALGSIALLGAGVWYLTRNRRWALLAATILALNLSFLIIGRAATADGLLNFFSLALALWVLVLLFPPPLPGPVHRQNVGARLRQQALQQALQRWGWVVSGTLGALAFLAKGPIAWLPALVMAGAIWWARPQRAAVWRSLAPFKTAALIVLLFSPWVLLLWQQHGGAFFYEFFFVHNLQRFGGDMGNSQSHFIGYYFMVLAVGFFPWVALLPPAIGALCSTPAKAPFWARFSTRLASPQASTALPLLALIWAAVYIIIFSFSGTKLAHYIVPAYPALAIIIAGWLAGLKEGSTQPIGNILGSIGWLLWGLMLAALLAVITPLLAGFQGPALHGLPALLQPWLEFAWPLADPLATATLQQAIPLGVGFYLAAAAVAASTVLVVVVRRGQRRALPLLAAAVAISLGAVAWGVAPTIWRYTQAPLAQVALILRQLPPGSLIVHHGLHKPSLRLLSGRAFIKTDSPVQVTPWLQQTNALWVVAEIQDIAPLVRELQTSQAGTVLEVKCATGACLLLLAPLQTIPE
jgi:4-amino-4-deoxy-L-arabinose transferase-like glycosyltransferase